MRRLAAKVFLIFLLAAGTAFSQDFHLYGFSMYNLEFLGSGARARSLGGAFVGVADDASALTWNPAGLIQISKTQASFSGSIVRLKTENDVKVAAYSTKSYDRSYVKDLLNLASGSFVAPVRIKGHPFVAAANYQRVIDDNDDVWNRGDVTYNVVTSSWSLLGNNAPKDDNTESMRNLHKFALGFGTDVYGNLSLGTAINIFYGNGASEYQGLVQDTLPLAVGTQVYDTIAVYWSQNTRDAQDLTGFGLTGSLMYRTEKFRIGATISAPYELVVEHDIKRADTLYVKSVRVPGRGVPASQPRPTLYLGKTKIEIPLTLGLGASVQVTPKFLLSGDIELRSTGSTKYFVRSEEPPATSADSLNLFTLPGSIYYNDTTETSYYDASGKLVEIFNEFELGYESSMQVRLGAEYMLATKYGTIPLRGGLRMTQLPYRDVSNLERDAHQQVQDGYVLGDKISRTSFSFGSGIHWNQIWLDAVVEMNKEEQTETGVSFYEGLQFNYEATRTKTVPSFMMTFTGFF